MINKISSLVEPPKRYKPKVGISVSVLIGKKWFYLGKSYELERAGLYDSICVKFKNTEIGFTKLFGDEMSQSAMMTRGIKFCIGGRDIKYLIRIVDMWFGEKFSHIVFLLANVKARRGF